MEDLVCEYFTCLVNPFSTRPHQNVVWYNDSWLGFSKNSEFCTKRKRNIFCKKWALMCQLNVAMAHRNYFRQKKICESSNWQHIQRLKINILGAIWHLFRLEKIAKCSYFILSTQNIKFYWFVMKIKTFLLLIWWYKRGLFPLGNKYVWGLHSEWVKNADALSIQLDTKWRGQLHWSKQGE